MTLRCIRHFAIYEQRWPSRVPPHGTSSATPRAENAPVEQRHVVRIGTKVSSAAHKTKNLIHDDQEEEEASPKRRRTIVSQKVSSTGHRDSKLGRDQEKASKTSAKFVAAYRAITLARDEEEEQEEEEMRPSRSQKALPVRIDPKMSSAVYKAKNLVPDEQEEEEGRPSKRPRNRKVSSAGYRGGGVRREKGKASAKRIATACRAIALLRDEQNEEEERLPRNQKVLPVRIGPKVSFAAYRAICGRDKQDRFSRRQKAPQGLIQIARRLAALNRNTSEPDRRKRGRPRLSSPRVMSKSKVKTEELQVDIPVIAQPRATNGRFGKKDKSWRKNREYTAVGSTVADDNDDLESRTPRRKRGIDAVEDFEEPPKKRSASEQNPDSGNDLEVEGPGQKVLPRPASGFRGGRLFSNPNPLRFALYAWAGPLILDESSDDDEKHPETPEDGLSSAADIAPAEELMDPMFLPSILPRAPPLTCKPSPFVFAKNRWNATSAALNKVVDNNRRASTNFTLSENNLRPNPRTSHVSSEVILSSLQKYLQLMHLCFFRSPDFPLLIVRAYVPSLKVILPRCGPMTKPTCPNCDTCILCSLLLLRL